MLSSHSVATSYNPSVSPTPPLQEELANAISQLIHVVNTSEARKSRCFHDFQHLRVRRIW